MGEGGHTFAHAVDRLRRAVGDEDFRLVARLREDEAPGIDHERASVARTVRRVPTALRRRDHVALTLDRPGAKQDLPMILARLRRESARNDEPARAPIDQRGLVSALEKLVERFGRETGIHVLFQNECREPNLSSGEEMQILRVAQECLANIRKHAQAHTVRVLFSCRSGGPYCLLVEDDGVGFEDAAKRGRPGEHIGLSIMEERARRLGGNLRIESEVGEGTRVELFYQPAQHHRVTDKRWII